VNGRRMLRASAACEEQRLWTKPQGATGGVPGVNGVGPLQGTHTHRYPLPVAPLISRFADSAVLLKRRPKTLPQLPRGSVYIIYESIQRLEA